MDGHEIPMLSGGWGPGNRYRPRAKRVQQKNWEGRFFGNCNVSLVKIIYERGLMAELCGTPA